MTILNFPVVELQYLLDTLMSVKLKMLINYRYIWLDGIPQYVGSCSGYNTGKAIISRLAADGVDIEDRTLIDLIFALKTLHHLHLKDTQLGYLFYYSENMVFLY